jgi:hypothetical protein
VINEATQSHASKIAHVKRFWSTNVALNHYGDSEIPKAPTPISYSDALCERHPIEVLGVGAAAVRDLFLDAMQRLADDDRSQGLHVSSIEHVNLELQVWMPGFEVPVWIDPGPYIGWLCLAATPSKHSDSGTIVVLDPRAGSAMSAIPGLPWGTPLVICPQRGSFAVVPGWLTSSVVPLEQQQTCVVVVATVGSAAPEKRKETE